MPEELISVLTKFHREVVLPDIERIVGVQINGKVNGLDAKIESLRDEMLSNFDAVYKRFDRLEIEYHALSAAVKRIE